MVVAVYPGTFDPLTRGHEDIVRRASGFGSLGIGVLNYNRIVPSRLAGVTRRCLEIPQTVLTAPLWLMRAELESDTFSPFLVGVYRRSNG